MMIMMNNTRGNNNEFIKNLNIKEHRSIHKGGRSLTEEYCGVHDHGLPWTATSTVLLYRAQSMQQSEKFRWRVVYVTMQTMRFTLETFQLLVFKKQDMKSLLAH
jgi:hypothetical protein